MTQSFIDLVKNCSKGFIPFWTMGDCSVDVFSSSCRACTDCSRGLGFLSLGSCCFSVATLPSPVYNVIGDSQIHGIGGISPHTHGFCYHYSYQVDTKACSKR